MRISKATQLTYRWAWALLALGLTTCTGVRPASPTPLVTPTTLTTTPPLAVTHAASPTLIQADTATVPPETGIADSPVPSETPEPTTVAPTPTQPPVIVHTNTPFPLSIVTFTITPAEIRPGESVTLTWEVIAEQAIIYTLDPQGRLSMPW